MSPVRSGWSWLTDEPRHVIGLRVLQICIGAMLLYRVCTEAPFAAHLWGPDGIGRGSMRDVWGPMIGKALDMPFSSMTGVWCVLALLAASAFSLMSGYYTRPATFVALVTFSQIGSRLDQLSDGGDNVCTLALVYL